MAGTPQLPRQHGGSSSSSTFGSTKSGTGSTASARHQQLPQDGVVDVEARARLVLPRVNGHPLAPRVQRGLQVPVRVERNHTWGLERLVERLVGCVEQVCALDESDVSIR